MFQIEMGEPNKFKKQNYIHYLDAMDEWSYTSTPQYAFKAWYSIIAQG